MAGPLEPRNQVVAGLGPAPAARPGPDRLRSLAALVPWLSYAAIIGALLATLVAAAMAGGNSLARAQELFTAPYLRESFLRTHFVAALSSASVLVLGVLFLFSWRLQPSRGMAALVRSPLLLTGFPAALAYLILFGHAGWLNRVLQGLFGLSRPPLDLTYSLPALAFFFTIFGVPYFLACTLHAISPTLSDLEDSARLLGCSPGEAFRRVTLPLLAGPLRAAVALVYILDAGSLTVPMMIGGSRNSLLSAEIYNLVASFADLAQAAMLALLFILSFLPPLYLLDRTVGFAIRGLAALPPRWTGRSPVPRRSALLGAFFRSSVGYQWLWYTLLGLLVFTPFYSSLVLDWGKGILARSWSLQWYRQIDPAFWSSVGLSFALSLGCVAVDLLLAFLLALGWRFSSLRGKGFLKAAVLAPIGIPGFVWGLALLSLAGRWCPPMIQTPWLLFAGQVFITLPFMLRVLMTALEDYDDRYLEIAAGLGAGGWSRFRRVLLPMVLPSISAGCVLVFVRSFSESNLSMMVAPMRYPTAPIWLYSATGVSGLGAASALEAVLVAVPLLGLLAWELSLRRATSWAETRPSLSV